MTIHAPEASGWHALRGPGLSLICLSILAALLSGCAGIAAREIGEAPGPDSGMFNLGYQATSQLGGESVEWTAGDGSEHWAVRFRAGGLDADYDLSTDGDNGRFRINFRVNTNPQAETHRGTVILLHSWRQSHEVMVPWASQLSAAGFETLIPDLRGHGQSGGSQVGFGVLEAGDVERLIDHLETGEAISKPLYLMGASLGASTALRAADDPRVSAVVAIAPFNDPGGAVVEVAREIAPWRSRLVGQRNLLRGFERAMIDAGLSLELADTAEAIRGLNTPALLIHGEDDQHVSVSHSRELAEVLDCGQLLILPDTGGHIASHVRLDWLDDWVLPFLEWSEQSGPDCRVPKG
ncbi:alpha/beta fold hydrolase [Gammaproteobacteria bacterium AB-CW1]|uniref:Alpha/beta fold hydrolase n=1 Tax=Natronospira elongata TaxID=3110268 RepID=A0AAP6JH63_9GAMM|nr:alpha/beta fold hydrolase [Gammaproteobacteria bacterium AB-CW1]